MEVLSISVQIYQLANALKSSLVLSNFWSVIFLTALAVDEVILILIIPVGLCMTYNYFDVVL